MAEVKFEKKKVYVAKEAYEAKAKNELSFAVGEQLKLVKPSKDDGWWQAQSLTSKKKGFVPESLLVDEGALELHEWCHGAISRNGAEYLLREHNEDGMYLIRESQSQPGNYTLDVWKDGKAVHYRVTQSDGGFYFRQSAVFPTIPELIAHHQETADGLCTRLIDHAPKAHAKTVVIGMEMDRKWEVKRDQIELGKRLGVGNYGEVYRGTYQGQPIAVKTIKEDSMETIEFMKEAHVMKKFNHPNLVRLIGVCSVELPMYIIQEFVPNGDLLTYLRRPSARGEINSTSQLYIASQVAAGMQCLEKMNVIHRDLAARNCLVGENLIVKVADFGMGRVVDDLYTARTGTKMPIKWTAPEALCYDAFSTKSDVWSFGILLWEISTFGDVPYRDMEARDVITKLEEGYRMPEPPNTPVGLYEIMCETWQMNAKERPNFTQLTEELEALHEKAQENPQQRIERVGTLKRPTKKWRDDFEAPAAAQAAAPAPETMDADLVMELFTLTGDVFRSAQHIFRFCQPETAAELSKSFMASGLQLIEKMKGVKQIDKATAKAMTSAIQAVGKAKNKAEKMKQAAEKVRDLSRQLNKSLKSIKTS
eukprot:m.32424 g.32424  ORF g.32424 m.32424 type:complete len:592 (-) comp9519_c0_seq2:165-1940(-)